jgi:putative FmdB family regulatory protein
VPTYEYRCKGCGEHLEVVQAFTDDSLTECPACGGVLKKVFGSIGITFKGSGFYKTDSRGGSKTPAGSTPTSGDGGSGSSDAGSSDAGSSDAGSSGSGSGDAKPAAKTSGSGSSGSGSTAKTA